MVVRLLTQNRNDKAKGKETTTTRTCMWIIVAVVIVILFSFQIFLIFDAHAAIAPLSSSASSSSTNAIDPEFDVTSSFFTSPAISKADPDKDCPFRHSSLYRKIYVYPTPDEEEWREEILSTYARKNKHLNYSYPWVDADKTSRREVKGPYLIKGPFVQYNTELMVRDIIKHPDSCLRTWDPDEATLFYVPYMTTAEYHKGVFSNGDYQTSPFGDALMKATKGDFTAWEEIFGLTSKYWQRRGGSDHILVYGEPMHGLWHPRSKRGNFHFINSQMQLDPPIAITVELSKTFIEMYPNCARKNIVMPYPNTNGEFFNGRLDVVSSEQLSSFHVAVNNSSAALPIEKEIYATIQKEGQDVEPRMHPRPLAQFYKAGAHGTCTNLRKSMNKDYACSPSGIFTNQRKLKDYELGYRQATFCPCPGGDSPSAKRMFDALFSGCIPIILSYDFVWPFTAEFDTVDKNGKAILLNPDDFSVRVSASDYEEAKHDDQCKKVSKDKNTNDLQHFMESMSATEIQRLRAGVAKASDAYAYYERSPNLPDNPMKENILPTGGAAFALVKALEERASGALWSACEEELKNVEYKSQPNKFKC